MSLVAQPEACGRLAKWAMSKLAGCTIGNESGNAGLRMPENTKLQRLLTACLANSRGLLRGFEIHGGQGK